MTRSASHGVTDERLTRPGVHRRSQKFLVTFLCTIQQRCAGGGGCTEMWMHLSILTVKVGRGKNDYILHYIQYITTSESAHQRYPG